MKNKHFATIFICFLSLFVSAQDSTPFPIRGIGGIQGGIGLFYPEDLNNFTNDFWDDLINNFYPSGYYGDNPIVPIIVGVNYRYKVGVRVVNAIQIEGWKEKFFAPGLQIKTDFVTYTNGNEKRLNATYSFFPSYTASGAGILFTPGASHKRSFFTFGGGAGKYKGQLEYKHKGNTFINNQTNNFDETTLYKGDVIGFDATLGCTYIPWKFIELETFLVGRWAKIPKLTNQYGDDLRNKYNENEFVELDFSGLDFRLGLKIIIP